MNKRTLIIAVAIAMPVVAIAAVTSTLPGANKTDSPAPVARPDAPKAAGMSAPPAKLPPTNGIASANPPAQPETLAQARERIKARLAHLDTITEDQWKQESTANQNPNKPKSLQEARDRARGRITALATMTETQWAAQNKPATVTRLPDLTAAPAAGK